MDATTNYSLEFYSTFKPDLMNTQHPDLIGKISQRMQPNGWSQVGFLAPGQDLVEICQKDAEILKARGITHAQIADRLEAVIMKANHLFRQLQDLKQGEIPQAIIEDKLCVPSYISTMGHQECPFTQDPQKRSTICGKGSSMITIINQTSKKQIDNITELHAHLIRDHHFFEGKAPYRLDPELAIEVLGLEPNRDYKVETVSQDIWSTIRGCSVLDEDARAAAKQDCIESIVDENGVFEAYLLPYKDWNI